MNYSWGFGLALGVPLNLPANVPLAGSVTADPVTADPETADPETADPETADPGGVDLAALLVRDPAATLLLRVSGPSMQGAGIDHGDLLLVDCGLEPRPGQVVVARLGDGFTVKRLVRWRGQLAL
ncbi:MAG: S24 family peptidase, partial [Cyanobacteriota bacterium]|nr:S24 family peptidase [Cyanobacteriota bacterium]